MGNYELKTRGLTDNMVTLENNMKSVVYGKKTPTSRDSLSSENFKNIFEVIFLSFKYLRLLSGFFCLK